MARKITSNADEMFSEIALSLSCNYAYINERGASEDRVFT